ncbi:hypothetical protein [Flavobacterium lipolyticum]|uniref:AbiTii domain-containing protein n=1 Tax=Flavobacterium lipolyticum TaxID=2893754 RepID=A0ABS8M6E8_9FLAO|nr:hypothetical protein [Flavobacterium sp. F-126]MCC9019793.1 hypothetical protein [Flavobacterium sp. F-126]
MIKQLIEDLTFDKISLSQALTRAKIIAYKINNNDFKEWLVGEINGGYKGRKLPKHRIIPCDIYAEVSIPFQGTKTIPMDVTSIKDLAGDHSFNEMRITQSIGTLELGQSQSGKNQYGYEYFPMDLTNHFKKMTDEGDSIIAIKRRIQLSQIDYILEQTKQRLLDTLLELNEKFPNLENDYVDSNANNQKVQNIITQNIYGNNSNSNIAVGDNINQSIVADQKIEELINELQKLGVDSNETNELKGILEQEDKKGIGKKVLNWLGKLSTKVVEKGMELQLPVIIEKLQDYL